jgi:hypothetical protein
MLLSREMGSQVHRPTFQVEIGVRLSEVVRQCVDDDQPDLRKKWSIRYQSEGLDTAIVLRMTCLVMLAQPRLDSVAESEEFNLRRRPDEVNALQDIIDRGCPVDRFSRPRNIINNEAVYLPVDERLLSVT